jgi:hypothetical protein
VALCFAATGAVFFALCFAVFFALCFGAACDACADGSWGDAATGASAAQAGTTIKANNNSNIFFMVQTPFVVKKIVTPCSSIISLNRSW